MNREIDRMVQAVTPRLDNLNLLEISGSRWTVSGVNGKYKSVTYPEYNICETALDETFNLIIAEMVFEHLPYPYKAGRNVFQMLNTPGFFLISVPFLYPVHNHPIDCTRWTQTGLRYFLAEVGFPLEKIYTDSWGNRECAAAHTGDPIEYDEDKHSLANETGFPVSVWAIAQK